MGPEPGGPAPVAAGLGDQPVPSCPLLLPQGLQAGAGGGRWRMDMSPQR